MGLAVLCTLAMPLVARAETPEQAFLEGLRSRGLFTLADRYCRERLEDATLAPREEVELTVERIRIRSEQAVQAPRDERETHWEAARGLAREFAQQHPRHPRGLLVRLQDALTVLARGQLARQEAEVAGDGEPLRELARDQLREAVGLLEDLAKELEEAVPLATRNRDDPATLGSGELFSLQRQVQYQLGRAHRNRGLCYPPGSENQLATLTAAMEHFQRPLTQLDAADPLWWQIRLEQAICHRLLKEYTQANEVLRELLAAGPSETTRWAIVAEAVRLQLAVGRAAEGLQLLDRAQASASSAPADVELARLECLLALWQAAAKEEDSAAAQRWQQQAVRQVAILEQQYGPFWGRRAELMLLRRSGSGTANLDVLERTAANLYRQGQLDEAVEAYRQASRQAAESNQAEAAFRLGYQAALIDQQREHHQEAGQGLRRIAMQWSRQPDAGRAHLLAAWNLAQVARQDPARIADYRQVLEEHLVTWDGMPSAAQAAQWLGALHEANGRWSEAARAYAQISRDSPEALAGLRSAVRCWKQHWRQMESQGESPESDARQALAWLESQVRQSDGRLPERWSEVARAAALEAAGLHLRYTPDGHARAEQLLRSALQPSPPPPEDWQAAAEGLLVVAVAGQAGRAAEAQGLLRQLSGQSPERLLSILRGLQPLADEAAAGTVREIARLQLQLVRQIDPQRQQLPEEEREELDRLHAQTLVASGERREAAEAFERLTRDHPRSATIQLAYARFLAAGDDRRELEAAVEQWRRVAAGARKNTDLWWEAKYRLAETLHKLGDSEQAAQRLEYLLATARFDSPQQRRRFETLLQRCRPRSPASGVSPRR